MSNVTKVKIDLYYVKTNSYTMYQLKVNMSNDDWDKLRKLSLKKDNDSRKIRWNATKVELELYCIKTNSHTKFQLNILKDCREKSGKLSRRNDRQTDGQTDSEETYSPPPVSHEGD